MYSHMQCSLTSDPLQAREPLGLPLSSQVCGLAEQRLDLRQTCNTCAPQLYAKLDTILVDLYRNSSYFERAFGA